MATCPSFLGRRCCRQLPWVEWTDAVAASRAVRRRAALGVCTGGRTFDRRAAGCAAGVAAGRRGASAAARTSRGRRHGTYGGIKHHGGHRDAARPAAGGMRAVRGDLCLVTSARGLWEGGVDEVPGGLQVPVSACCPRMVARSSLRRHAHRVFPLHGRRRRASCSAGALGPDGQPAPSRSPPLVLPDLDL